MTLHYPNATWRPISHNVGGTIVPRAVVWHTAVDTGAPAHSSLFAWFNSTARKGTSAHMFIEGDGSAEQYVDFGKLAGHAFAANTFAIGVETHDGGNPNVPWTPAQVAQMVAFMRWCRSVFGIPIAPIKTASGSGHGYHSQFAAWNLSSHQCPGPVRVAQLQQVIAIAAGQVNPPVPPISPPSKAPKEPDLVQFINDNFRGAQCLFILGDAYHEIALSGDALTRTLNMGIPAPSYDKNTINGYRTAYGQPTS